MEKYYQKVPQKEILLRAEEWLYLVRPKVHIVYYPVSGRVYKQVLREEYKKKRSEYYTFP